MAQYDGSIRINTTLNTAGFNTGAKSMMSSLGRITKAFGIAFSVGALIKFGKEAIGLASDLAEVDNVVSKSFGSMRGEMDALADSAIKNLGMSRLTAYKTGSTFMSMGKSMLDSAEDAKDMALALTKLTGNMSSFFNVSQDLASIALKSIYTGETETLKQYGVVMTEVNLKQFALAQGITKSYSEMTQSEKVMLRYQYVMQQLSFIGDDFIDTQDSWANQTRILSEQWKEFMSIIGNGLITVLTPLVKMLNTAVAALINFAKALGNVLGNVFGIQWQQMSDTTSSGADGFYDLADAADEYGDSVEAAGKKTKKALASFDDLNVLAQDGSSGSTGGIGASLGSSIDIPAEAGAQTEGVMDSVLSKTEAFIAKLKTMFGGIVSSVGQIFSNLYNGAVGGMMQFISDKKAEIKNDFGEIYDVVASVWSSFEGLLGSLAEISTVLSSESGLSIVASTLGIIYDLLSTIIILVMKGSGDIVNTAITPIVNNTDKIKKSLQGVLDLWAPMLSQIEGFIGYVKSQIIPMYDQYISPIFSELSGWLTSLISIWCTFWQKNIKPGLDWFVQKILPVLMSSLKDGFDKLKRDIEVVCDVIWVFVRILRGSAETVEKILNGDITGAFESMKETVTDIMDKLWTDGIQGTVNSIIGGIETMANGVVSGINTMIDALNSLSFTIPDWVPEYGGNSFGFHLSKLSEVSIPRLANGGITTGSTLANIGEAGREAVLPLENNLGYLDKFAEKIADKIPAENTQPVYLQIDGQTFARLLNPYSKAEDHRIGISFA